MDFYTKAERHNDKDGGKYVNKFVRILTSLLLTV